MSHDDLVLGIDLGTTYSVVAAVNRHGRAEVLPSSEGDLETPSVVHFYDAGACVVGAEAMKMAVVDSPHVVRFIKRHMGEDQFILAFHGRTWTPQEISALILKKLKEDAEDILGAEVRDAVITVPAYFNSAQRGATAEAGRIAGLEVLSIINEPTAAAIAYGLDRLGGRRRFLVFDLGGGTFDVTVMAIDGQRLSTMATGGESNLGGKDWDDRLLDHVATAFQAEHGCDPRDDLIAYQGLYERCLYAKISLSTKDRTVIPVQHQGRRTVVQVTREEFEEMTADLMQRCVQTTLDVLNKAGMTWRDLDDVLLVGGATRMPMIRNRLTSLASMEPVHHLDPDHCVAMGAALAGVIRHRPDHPARNGPATQPTEPGIQEVVPSPRVDDRPRGAVIGLADGGHVAERAALPQVTIEDTTTHTLGIVALDRDRQERVLPLLPEGTPLPCEIVKTFTYAYENMTAVRVEVTEGDGDRREDVTIIGRVELTGLPPRPRGTRIQVIYAYGMDQILSVRVIDVETGRQQNVDIRFQGGMSAEQVDAARARAKDMVVD